MLMILYSIWKVRLNKFFQVMKSAFRATKRSVKTKSSFGTFIFLLNILVISAATEHVKSVLIRNGLLQTKSTHSSK